MNWSSYGTSSIFEDSELSECQDTKTLDSVWLDKTWCTSGFHFPPNLFPPRPQHASSGQTLPINGSSWSSGTKSLESCLCLMRVCLLTQSRTHHQFPDQPYEGNPAALEPRTAWSAPSPSPYLRSNAVSPQWRSALEDGHQQPSPPLLHLGHCASPATSSTNNNYRGLSQEQDKWTHQRRQGDQLVLEHPKGL